MPYIVLVAECEIVRLDRWVNCQRHEVCARTKSRAASDLAFRPLTCSKPCEHSSCRVSGSVIGRDQEPIFVRLISYRPQLIGKECGTIFGAHQYGDERHVGALARLAGT